MAKVFISFLGTSSYKPCKYVFEEKTDTESVRFVQETILRNLCTDWTEEDKVLIFLTKDAEKKNWYDSGQDDLHTQNMKTAGQDAEGLKTRLKRISLAPRITPVTGIKEGGSVDDIWEIFMQVQEQIQEGDLLFLDITHGFRSLPMLVMVLLQYLKIVKKTDVGGIYYGAYEYPLKVERPGQARMAPVFDLIGFHTLQNWTAGADVLVNYGNAGRIENVLRSHCGPILKKTRGGDKTARHMNKLADLLKEMTALFETVRGYELIEGRKIVRLRELIIDLKKNKEILAPLKPLLAVIEEKVSGYKAQNLDNGFRAVDWCIEHELVQQGITLLQETIVTWLLTACGLNRADRRARELAGQQFSIIGKNIPESRWLAPSKDRKEDARDLQKIIRSKESLVAYYNELSTLRNDINHGGYNYMNDDRARDASKFTRELNNLNEMIKDCLSINI